MSEADRAPTHAHCTIAHALNAKGNVWGRLKKIVKKSIALCFTLLKNLTVLLKKILMVRYTYCITQKFQQF